MTLSGVQDQEEFMSGAATIGQWPGLAVLDQDIPARVVSAVSHGTGFVVISVPPGSSGEDALMSDCLSAVTERLSEAGFVSTTMTAPLPRLAVLTDAISGAMSGQAVSGRPLVVVIRQAEALSDATARRLAALAELRQDGQPVLQFLLAGTSDLWPVLLAADLGHLEDDAVADIRLTRSLVTPPPALPIKAAEPSRATERPLPSPIGTVARGWNAEVFRLRGSLTGYGPSLVRLGVVGIGLAGIIAAGWFILAPGPAGAGLKRLEVVRSSIASAPVAQPPAAAPPALASSPDAQFAFLIEKEKNEIASHQLFSPPGDNLVETRRQIDAILPLLSNQVLRSLTEASTHADAEEAKRLADNAPAATPAPIPSAGSADTGLIASPLHVTLRYSRGDGAAEARAVRLLALLRSSGILADGPEPAAAPIERSTVAYYFVQDQDAALDLVKRLLPHIQQIHKPVMSRGASADASLPRPGAISISIGSRDDVAETPAAPGKQT